MTTTDLAVRQENSLDQGRETDLAKLISAAENADSPQEAHHIMLQGKVISEALKQMKAPMEESRSAGKASVLAGRKLGRLLAEIPGGQGYGGRRKTPRAVVRDELGIDPSVAAKLMRLSRIPEDEFQRYIQRKEIIPTVTGAFRTFEISALRDHSRWNKGLRKRIAGVKNPTNPSLDEAHSLIVRALGHLDAIRLTGGPKQNPAVATAMNALYSAEDVLRPFRGGYHK